MHKFFNSLMDWTHAVMKIVLTLYRIVDVVVILKIERLSAKIFFSWLRCSFRRGSQVVFTCTMFQKCFLDVWKNRNPPCCCCFLVSLAHNNKSVKLKKHKHKKSYVSRISVKGRKREKNIEKRITNLQSTVHYKKNHRDPPCFPGNP